MTFETDHETAAAAELLQAGRTADAERRLRDLLEREPTAAEALQLLGVLKHRSGQLQEAETLFLSAMSQAPELWTARVNLSALYGAQGRRADALEQAREATRLAPEQSACWRQLATVAESTREFSLASEAAEQLSRLGAAQAVDEMKGALYGILARRLDVARAAIERARTKGASPLQLFAIEAELASTAGEWQHLKKVAEAWLAAAPSSAKARETAARAELELGNIEQAAATFRPLIEGQANIPPEHALIYGRICLNAQLFDDAERYLDAAHKALPENADALTALARLRTFEGDFDDAKALCEKAIASAPDNPRPYIQLSVSSRGDVDPAYEDRMRHIYTEGSTDPAAQAGLAFALGDVLYRRRAAEDSLEFYSQGNELRRSLGAERGFRYQHEIMEKDVELLREAADLLPHMEEEAVGRGATPLFITGLPRSGTTLIERIVGAHGRVTPMGERRPGPELLETLLLRARRDGAEAAVDWLRREAPALRARYMQGTEDVQTAYFTDKMPGNALAIPFLAFLFPRSRFLLTKRRAFDVAVSIYRHQFPFAYSWSHRWEDMGAYIPVYLETAARFVEAEGGRAGIVDYDLLVEDPAARIPQVIEAVGLEWDEACASPEAGERLIATFSSVQVRKPISPTSSDGGSLFRALMETYADDLEAQVAVC